MENNKTFLDKMIIWIIVLYYRPKSLKFAKNIKYLLYKSVDESLDDMNVYENKV